MYIKQCSNRFGFKAGRLVVVLLVFLMLTGIGIPTSQLGLAKVHAAPDVSSWSDLKNAVKSAVESGGPQTITLSSDFAYDGTSIEIPGGANITITGNQTIFSSTQDAYDSMFKVKSGGSLTIDSGVTLSAKIGNDGQTCPDGVSDTPPTYTEKKFSGGLNNDKTDYEPRGFFIHVEKDGTATLRGTVSDFVTSRDKATTPRYVAPIVANGSNAKFNLDGGTIKNNLVGYIVDDRKAYEDAQTIKQYVKGAGPNVPRKPNAETQKANSENFGARPRNKDAGIDGGSPGAGITATAGAVIYKGGAKGNVAGIITNNRGDTGGIMVSGEETEVNVQSGTAISKNVGVQFGGGSTVEQGGSIKMSGGEMFENVAWFGGGAVYATENGVAWLLGLLSGDGYLNPQFEKRVGGVFEMTNKDASLHNNTAFTRGGAILADSNGVHITKGKLQDNMSRMLGGAVYVMGDHPLYTYTMHLDFVHIHDNTAVSGQYGRPQWGQNYPEKQEVPGLPASQSLADKNNLLQTKLKAPDACADSNDIFKGTDDLISKNTDDMNDGRGTDGTGGGVWLCAYGSTTFDAGDPAKVFIDNNYATGTKGTASKWDSAPVRAAFESNAKKSDVSRSGRSGGSDFHSDTGDVGSVTIKHADSSTSGWKNENGGDSFIESEFTSSAILNLVSTKPAPTYIEYNVEVSGNIARRGGGLAADGTFFLGVVDDSVTVDAQMQLAKKWAFTADKTPIAIRVEATDKDGKTAVVADVPLDGVANPPLSEFDTIEELQPTTDSSNGSAIWNGKFNLPLQLDTPDGDTIEIFKFTVANAYVDGPGTDGVTSNDVTPTNATGSSNLAKVLTKIRTKNTDQTTGEVDQAAVNAEIKEAITITYNNGLKFSCKELEVEYDDEIGAYVIKTDGSGNPIEKTDENGNPINNGKYVLTWENPDPDKVSFDLNTTVEKVVNEETGEESILYSVHMLGISIAMEAANDNDAIVEKYVNKDVHSNIINFDQDFTYDVMAYVPMSATELTISDPLVNGLEFAKADGTATTNAQEAIQQIVIQNVNNHKTGESGTVSSPVSENLIIKKNTVQAKITGENTISITIDNESRTEATGSSETNALKAARGKWVQLTFNARIKNEYRNTEALKALASGVEKPSEETKSWEDEKSDKKGYETRVYTTGNGDLALVAPLAMEIGPDEVIWAVEGPSRLFAKTASGKYYATPMYDKEGESWALCEEGEDDWTNANNRYNGNPPQAYNTVDSIDLDSSKLDNLKNLDSVKRETIVEACEGPSRLFAKTSGGDYYLTPLNDKSGTVWEKAEEGSDDWNNANNRFSRTGYESRNTVRFLDLNPNNSKLVLDPAEMNNWPVISDETHEGMANQASYSVKFGNNATVKTYKTNTVTVTPETTELTVEKIWGADGKEKWPKNIKSVTFNVYAIPKNNIIAQVYVDGDNKVVGVGGNAPSGSKPLTVTVTKDDPDTTDKDESKAIVTGLPRLKGYIYLARETKITDADGHEHDLEYNNSENINERIITDPTTVGESKIFTSLKFSYAGDGKKFESLRDKKNKKVVRGAIADNRLWAMALDGSYWVTAEGDTTGDENSNWEKITKPDQSETQESKFVIYDRVKSLLGSIDSNGRFIPPTVGADAFDIENVVTAINTEATTEKYVNNDVHADIDEFDKAFKYDIMVYVPAGTTELTITDPLVSALEFAKKKESLDVADGSKAEKTTDASESISAVVYKARNDHKANSTVAGNDENNPAHKIASDKYSASIDEENNRLEVAFKGEADSEHEGMKKPLEFAGNWVQVTFWAKYTDDIIRAASIGDMAKIRDNGAVVSDRYPNVDEDAEEDEFSHKGTLNKASAKIKVNNTSEFTLNTNEVTVKPETTKVYVQKKLKNLEDVEVTSWPDGLEVKVNVYKNIEGSDEEPEIVDTIVIKDLDVHASAILPKLIGVTYTAEESEVIGDYAQEGDVSGEGTEEKPFTITNKEKKFVDVEATKKWKGVVVNDIPSPEDFKDCLVLKKIGEGDEEDEDVTATYADNLSITARGATYRIKWSKLPDGEYSVEEKEIPGFETTISEDGKTITNTKEPSEEKPEIEKYVNQAVHKDIAINEVFTYDIIAYVTKDADSVKISDTLNDMLTFEGSSDDVTVVDLGESDNHLVTNNVRAEKVNDNATVAQKGEAIEAAKVDIDGQTLTVFITNKLRKTTVPGEPTYTEVEIEEVNPAEEGYYEITGGDGSDEDPYVYTKTEDITPEAGKTYYEQVGDADEPSYTEVEIPSVNPAEEGYYEITGGDGSDEDPYVYTKTKDTTANRDRTYYKQGDPEEEEIDEYEYDGDDQPATALRGHWIKVTFKARINGKTLEEVKKAYQEISADQVDEDRAEDNVGNAPVVSVEDHSGIPNDASYTIGVANEAGIEEDVHKDSSNVVTVKPQGPEIEKYVNKAVHKDLKFNEVFTYDIIAYVTGDADSVKITDTLCDVLEYVSKPGKIKVVDLGDNVNHKPENNISAKQVNKDASVAAKGTEVKNAKVTINGKKLSVNIPDAKAYRGHWLKITFDARIIPSAQAAAIIDSYDNVKSGEVYKDSISGGKRAEDNVGNAPVLSAEDHNGIPNTAAYTISVNNKVRYEDTSNTVTVKPSNIIDYEEDSQGDDVRDVSDDKQKSVGTGDDSPIGWALSGLIGGVTALFMILRRRLIQRS